MSVDQFSAPALPSWSVRAPALPEGRPRGYCWCGCGERTSLARFTKANGDVAGEPLRYIRYHHRRKSFVEYIEDDRGFLTPCWIWQRAIITDGYGQTWEDGGPKMAHRAYYERKYGLIPAGLEVHHLCGVRSCVNPDHLEAMLVRGNRLLRGVNMGCTLCPCCGGTGLAPEEV